MIGFLIAILASFPSGTSASIITGPKCPAGGASAYNGSVQQRPIGTDARCGRNTGSPRLRWGGKRMELRKESIGYYCATVGNGVDDEITVRHDLNCPFPIVQIYEAATIGYVTMDFRIVDVNTIHLSFRRRPDKDEFVVVVVG